MEMKTNEQKVLEVNGWDESKNPFAFDESVTITYSVSNPLVLSVIANSADKGAQVTALAEGYAEITASMTSADGKVFNDVLPITVTTPVPTLQSISIHII